MKVRKRRRKIVFKLKAICPECGNDDFEEHIVFVSADNNEGHEEIHYLCNKCGKINDPIDLLLDRGQETFAYLL